MSEPSKLSELKDVPDGILEDILKKAEWLRSIQNPAKWLWYNPKKVVHQYGESPGPTHGFSSVCFANLKNQKMFLTPGQTHFMFVLGVPYTAEGLKNIYGKGNTFKDQDLSLWTKWLLSEDSPWKALHPYLDSRVDVPFSTKYGFLFKDVNRVPGRLLHHFGQAVRFPREHPRHYNNFMKFVSEGVHPTMAAAMALYFQEYKDKPGVFHYIPMGTGHTWMAWEGYDITAYLPRLMKSSPKKGFLKGTLEEDWYEYPILRMFQEGSSQKYTFTGTIPEIVASLNAKMEKVII